MDLSVVIVTLMKLPEAKMAALKKDFGKAGLGLEGFIASIIRHLPQPAIQEGRANTREAKTERIDTASDLMDFFSQVDVDGKGIIYWEDFLSYIIEQSIALKRDVKFQDCYRIREDYDFPCSNHKEYIHRVVWNPLHNRLFCCIGQRVRIFNLFTKELSRARLSCDIELSARGSLDYVGAHDIVYVQEEDLLLVLQINLCVSFYKCMSRQFISPEYIAPAGDVTLSHQQYKMRWSAATQQVITVGNDSSIMCWGLKKVGELSYTLVHKHTLTGHSDVVHAVLFVTDQEGTELLVSAGLDKRILFWDLATYRLVKCLSGHRGGIMCLAYDGDAQVFSGGYDNEIYVWDVKGSISSPTYKLAGPHKCPLQALSCAPDTGRLCSLDRQGKAALWDVRKSVALDPRDRCIQVLPLTEKDRCSCVEMVAAPSVLAKRFTLNSITLVLSGHRLHLYDCVDPRPPDAPPTMVVYNPESVTILTVHGRGVKVWEACTGQLLKEFVSLSRSDISGLTLDKGRRKLILSNLDGDLCFHNYFNGALLRQIKHKGGYELSSLMRAEEAQLLVTVSSDRALRVVDELAVSDTDCMLRLVTQAHMSDICVSAFCERLGLLATGAEDGLLKIWDAEFMCLEASLPCFSEPTALAFAFPHPLLLLGDSTGVLTLLPVRPWAGRRPRAYIPAAKWHCQGLPASSASRPLLDGHETEDRRYAPSSIACLSVITYTLDGVERQRVYVANASGVVRGYDLGAVLERLGMGHCADGDLPGQKPNFNPRRKVVRRSAGDGARDGLNVSMNRTSNLNSSSSSSGGGEAEAAPVLLDNALGAACLVHAWVAHEEVILCMSVLPQPQVLFTSSQDMSVKLWAYNGAALGVLTWGRQADLSMRRFWNFPFDFSERHRNRTARALQLLDSLRAHHGDTVARFLGDGNGPGNGQGNGNGDEGAHKKLPRLRSPTSPRATTIAAQLPLQSPRVAPVAPASTTAEAPQDKTCATHTGYATGGGGLMDEHGEEVSRILGQLHGLATWQGDQWDGRGHKGGELGSSYTHAAKERELHERHESEAAKRRRRRRVNDGRRKRDPILQTIKSVDRVVAKYAHADQLHLLAAQKMYAKREAGEREEKDPLGCYDVLRAVYEERHHTMYPHLHADRDRLAAQSDFSRALRKLQGLKTLLDQAEAAQANTSNNANTTSTTINTTGTGTQALFTSPPVSGRKGVRLSLDPEDPLQPPRPQSAASAASGASGEGNVEGVGGEAAGVPPSPRADATTRRSLTSIDKFKAGATQRSSVTMRGGVTIGGGVTQRTDGMRGSVTGGGGLTQRTNGTVTMRGGGTMKATLKLSLSVGRGLMDEKPGAVVTAIKGGEGEDEEGAEEEGGEAAREGGREEGARRSGGTREAMTRLTKPTMASIHMETPAKHHHKPQPRRDLMSSREKQEKRVKSKRRFGPYCREDLLDLYDAFRSLDHRKKGSVALRDLLGCGFMETNPDFRAQLARHYYGTEGGEGKVLSLKQALRLVFPLMGRHERRQMMVLIDMHEHHLSRSVKKAVSDVNDTQKRALLKSLFEVYDRDGSGTVEVWELVEGLKQGRSGAQWQGMVKEIETLVSQYGAKGGLLTFEDFVRVFHEIL